MNIEPTLHMAASKPITVKGRAVGGGQLPVIIAPLVGRTGDEVLAELNRVLAKRPDIVEWRADFFADIVRPDAVVDLARRIKKAAGDVPLLFTIRAAREGGEKISLTDDQIVELYAGVCRNGAVDLVDFELSNAAERLNRVRGVSRDAGIAMIMSYHNFQHTPALDVLTEKFTQAAQRGADVAKVAVMPKNLHDVLILLTATLNASEALDVPLISMSMGGQGSLSRLFGWAFGSSATFAVGDNSSAPGQIPIDELRQVIDITQRALSGK
jgi:3-dehydroquinate dehydratase I